MSIKTRQFFGKNPNLVRDDIKPVGKCKVNRDHPLSRGLLCAYLFPEASYTWDAAQRYNSVLSRTNNVLPFYNGLYGTELRAINGADQESNIDLGSITSNDPLSGYVTKALSIYSFGYYATDGPTVYAIIMSKNSLTTASNGWGLWTYRSNGEISFVVDQTTKLSYINNVTSYRGVSASYEEGDVGGVLYYDGSPVDTCLGDTAFSANSANTSVGNYNLASNDYLHHGLVCCYVWDRTLSPDEHIWVHNEKYCFLEPI